MARQRIMLIAVGFLMILALIGGGIAWNSARLPDQPKRLNTINAIRTNNGRVNLMGRLCDDIHTLTGDTNPCEGYYIDARTYTPTPLPSSYPTFSDWQRTATKMAHQYAVTATLGAICPSLAAIQVTSRPCDWTNH